MKSLIGLKNAGFTILMQRPHDTNKNLLIVGAIKTTNSFDEFVVWYYNIESNEYVYGDYFSEYVDFKNRFKTKEKD